MFGQEIEKLTKRRRDLRRQLQKIREEYRSADDTPWRTFKEERGWEALEDELDDVTVELDDLQVQRERERARLEGRAAPSREDALAPADGPRAGRPEVDPGRRTPSGTRFVNPKTGAEVRSYGPAERMADREADDYSLGRYIIGLATGDWSGAEEERALAAESDPSGGYLIPSPLSGRVIDLARSGSSVMAAGVQTVEMDSKTLTLARVASDPVPGWKAENDAITQSDPTFDAIELEAKTLVSIVPISIEAAEDSANLPQVVEQTLRAALGLELDRALLRGSEPDTADARLEPVGIRWTDGVQLTSHGSVALSDWDPLSQDIQSTREQDGEPSALIWHPTLAGQAERFKDANNRYLDPPESVAQINKIRSTQVPTDLGAGNDETELYVGDFSEVVLGMRREMRIEVSREGGSSFDNLQILVRAYLRADAMLEHPEHFHVRHAITV